MFRTALSLKMMNTDSYPSRVVSVQEINLAMSVIEQHDNFQFKPRAPLGKYQ